MEALLAELLEVAVAATVRAGAVLDEGRHRARTDVVAKSSATDLVSDVDRQAEAAVLAVIGDARPGDGVLAEESGAAAGRTQVRWVVDPLDGTTNYLYGFPAFCVSVAAEVDGEIAVGAVHDPNRDETFTAVRGHGAFLGADRLRVEGAQELATALVGTGFAYRSEVRSQQAAVLARVLPAVRDIRRAGSAALDLCWVGCGRLDAYYEFGLQPWDMAAGSLVAAEAGASVGTLGGGPTAEDVIVAGPEHLAAALRRLLRPPR